MAESFAELAKWEFSPEHLHVLRELLSYDALCTRSNNLVEVNGLLQWELSPSPLHWSRMVEWPWSILHSALKPTDTCLEVGGGWGVVQYAIAKRCMRLVELEPNPDPLQQVRWMQKTHGLGGNIAQVQKGILDVADWPDATFDHVFCISVIEHLPTGDAEKAVQECIRLLKPGGRFILTMDVRVGGEFAGGGQYDMKDEFNLDIPRAQAMLNSMGIAKVYNHPTRVGNVDGAHIVVLLVCYIKPGEVQ